MTPARPMLADVLAALTDLPVDFWRAVQSDRVVVARDAVSVLTALPSVLAAGPVAWTVPDPAKAWEVLQTRDLIPGDYEGRFACTSCGGTSRIVLRNDLVDYFAIPCHACPGPLSRPYLRPQTLPELVSWASLGFVSSDDGQHPGILGAEELARRTRRGVQVLWRSRSARPRPWLVGGLDLSVDEDMNVAVLSVPPLGGRVGHP